MTATSVATEPLFRMSEQNAMRRIFREKFDENPFLFQHRLSEDPLFDMACIRELAGRLPGKVHFSGGLAVDKGWNDPAARKLGFEQTLDQLEEGQSWIILKKVHEDAEYGPFLRQCLLEVEELAQRRLERLIESRTMSLILSSPGQVTPYHVDADCNFLFQIRGCKMFYVFNGRDRSILPEEEEEAFWGGNISAAHFREEHQAKAWPFAMQPGNGVHVPVMFPHWVKNGDNISISLSMNFRFHGRIRGDLHRMNHFLRKLGLHPRPTGESKVADSLKTLMIGPPRAGMKMLRQLRRRSS